MRNEIVTKFGSDFIYKQNIKNLLNKLFFLRFFCRQLESELSALTEENNAHLADLTRQIDDLRHEKIQLQELLQNGIEEIDESNIEALRQSERYLRYELQRSVLQYSQLQVGNKIQIICMRAHS